MRKFLKISIALLLSVAIIFSSTPSAIAKKEDVPAIDKDDVSVLATGDIKENTDITGIPYAVKGGNIYFDSTTGEIIGCDKNVTKAVIPNSINGKSVTSIGDRAFGWCRSLTHIIIPNCITNMGDRVFEGCVSLTSIILPNGITSIGEGAFAYCDSLNSVKIPDSVTSIGKSSFYMCCSLTNVEIPNSVTNIGSNAFWECDSLTSIVIPGNIASMGYGVFKACRSLTDVEISNGITTIEDDMFEDCYSLTKVKIPNSVTSIEDSAFDSCYSLASIKIPNSVTSIEDNAFKSCRSLTNIEIPNSVTNIGSSAFEGCLSLINIKIPNNIINIENATFYYCLSLTSVVIPDSVTSIGFWAFKDCNVLTDIYYGGTKSQWDSIKGHTQFSDDVKIHYNSTIFSVTDISINTDFVSNEDDPEVINHDVSLFGDYTTLHTMQFKVHNGKVYANAKQLSNLFGYSCTISTKNKNISILNTNNLSYISFHSDSKDIEYMLGLKALKYTAPFESIITDDQTAWLPFQYFLFLVDSGYIDIGRIHIESPKTTAIKILKQMMIEGISEYNFDLFEELGLDDQSFITQSHASHLVNYFNGILGLDPASWGLTITQFVDSSSYDKKYGDTLSTLFCTNSIGEFKDFVEKSETVSDSMDVLIKWMDETKYLLDFNVGQWDKTCELMLDRLQKSNPPTIIYNELYQQLENALENQETFSSFVTPVMKAKEKLPSSDMLTIISYGLKGYSYFKEFEEQDRFSINAFKKFLKKIPDDSCISSATKKTMQNNVSAFEENKLVYAVSNIVSDNWLDIIFSETGLEDYLLGSQGAIIKLVWDLSSSFIPFISDNLSDADNFDLACYAFLFQADAMSIYREDSCTALSGNLLSTQDLEESLYSAYTFLKSCLIAREAGISSVSRLHYKVPDYIESLKNKNKKIEKLMAQIRFIIVNQYTGGDNRDLYGFTQDLSYERLKKYDDSFLVSILIKEKNSLRYQKMK